MWLKHLLRGKFEWTLNGLMSDLLKCFRLTGLIEESNICRSPFSQWRSRTNLIFF